MRYTVTVTDYPTGGFSPLRTFYRKRLSLTAARRVCERQARRGLRQHGAATMREVMEARSGSLAAECLRHAAHWRRLGCISTARAFVLKARRWRTEDAAERAVAQAWEAERGLKVRTRDSRAVHTLQGRLRLSRANWGADGGVFPSAYRTATIR